MVSRKISLFDKMQRGRSPSFEFFQLDMYAAVAAKDRDASNLTRHFHWGLPSSQGGTTPKLKDLGNNFYMN